MASPHYIVATYSGTQFIGMKYRRYVMWKFTDRKLSQKTLDIARGFQEQYDAMPHNVFLVIRGEAKLRAREITNVTHLHDTPNFSEIVGSFECVRSDYRDRLQVFQALENRDEELHRAINELVDSPGQGFHLTPEERLRQIITSYRTQIKHLERRLAAYE